MPRLACAPEMPTTYDELVELLRTEEATQPTSLRQLRIARPEFDEQEEQWLSVGALKRIVVGTFSAVVLVCVLVYSSKRDSTSWLQGRDPHGNELLSLVGAKATTLRWLAHPTKCLDVAGLSAGAGLQIWDCDPNYPYQQEFLLPPDGETGHIKWATHPDLCLDAPGGIELQFWRCDVAPADHLLWTVSPDGKGRIHMASDHELCVDVPDEKENNGWKLQVWPCHNYTFGEKDEDMRFITHPVDCQWDDWEEWGPCSASCGGGERSRTRSVVLQPINGGEECVDSKTKEPCNTSPCIEAVSTSQAPTPKAEFGHLEEARHSRSVAAPHGRLLLGICSALLAVWAA